MEKGKIVSISNYGDVNRYVIKKKKDIHTLFCNMFSNLKLGGDSIIAVDIVFDDLDNEYIYIDESKKGFEIHFFITKDMVNMVIKTKTQQQKLNQTIKEYFILPK